MCYRYHSRFFFPWKVLQFETKHSFTNIFSSRSKPDPPLIRFHSARLAFVHESQLQLINQGCLLIRRVQSLEEDPKAKKKCYDLIK